MVLPSSRVHSRRAVEFAESVVRRAGVVDPVTESALLEAFTQVPRYLFIPERYHSRVFDDVSLPIGFEQSSMQPSLLARMLGLLCIRPGMQVLEIGIGSGYAAAILAALGARVYGLESVGLLAQQTRKRLDALGFPGVLIRRRSGLTGWEDFAPYDAILVSTPVADIPEALLNQLQRPGGVLVAPVGTGKTQQLYLVEQQVDGPGWCQLEGCCV